MSTPSDYMPVWVPIDQLSTLEIYPCDIIGQLIHDIKTDFSDAVKNIELIKTNLMFKSRFLPD